MARRRSVLLAFSAILLVVTAALCEVAFRTYDHFTMPQDNLNMDVWIKKISEETQQHPSLGYQYRPLHVFDERTQADEFGMRNAKEALLLDKVDVAGIGDSFLEVSNRVFFDDFEKQGIKYRSLGIFGYGPAHYNLMMKEFGARLSPRVYVYSTYLGNDPGDVLRYETWRASGKEWYEYNGGYVFPIERQGLAWGWRMFMGRAKGFARSVVNRINPDSFGAMRAFVQRDDAETLFEYIQQAAEIAREQDAALVVTIVPRTVRDKPLLDPVAAKLTGLCMGKGITCLDLDPSFGDLANRPGLFAPDEHWNDAGMEAAWKYLWDQKLQSLLAAPGTGL